MSANVSLDGVIEDPAGDEGFERGGWVGMISDRPDLGRATLDEALGAAAMLLGRRTYDWLAARWPSRTGELADRLNTMPKYMVSSTLAQPTWNNTTVLTGGLAAAATDLKRKVDGDIVLAGSSTVARTLLEHDLVDELRLKVFPVVLGAGKRLFAETSAMKTFHLVGVRTLDGDTALLTYQRTQEGMSR